jgi:diamine N-acetyltransferase
MEIRGSHISLRPAILADRQLIYQWLTQSELTKEMMGPPVYPETHIPGYAEFESDYVDHYFNGTKPYEGRCFVIEHKGAPVGQINYNPIDTENHCTELDIWMAGPECTGKGYGTEAIELLCGFLHRWYGLTKIYIAPSARNVRAIKAYARAGFAETDDLPEDFIPDYHDTVVMVKQLR